MSFLFTAQDKEHSYRVLIANLPTIVTDTAFDKITDYPTVANDYAYTLSRMRNIPFDLWLASHAGQFNLHKKRKEGAAYNPMGFADQAGYDEALKDLYNEFAKKKSLEFSNWSRQKFTHFTHFTHSTH